MGQDSRYCAEAETLKRAYDEVMCRWRLHRVMLLDGSLKGNGHVRKQLLDARRQAADGLYMHVLQCPVCKPSEADTKLPKRRR